MSRAADKSKLVKRKPSSHIPTPSPPPPPRPPTTSAVMSLLFLRRLKLHLLPSPSPPFYYLSTPFLTSVSRLLSSTGSASPQPSLPNPHQLFSAEYLIHSCELPSDVAVRVYNKIQHFKPPDKLDAVLRSLLEGSIGSTERKGGDGEGGGGGEGAREGERGVGGDREGAPSAGGGVGERGKEGRRGRREEESDQPLRSKWSGWIE